MLTEVATSGRLILFVQVDWHIRELESLCNWMRDDYTAKLRAGPKTLGRLEGDQGT